MARRRPGKLKIELQSKGMENGVISVKTHKPGKTCEVERNDSNPGQYIIWFASRRYAAVDAIRLHDTVEVEGL